VSSGLSSGGVQKGVCALRGVQKGVCALRGVQKGVCEGCPTGCPPRE
jgi:hypothetical protein